MTGGLRADSANVLNLHPHQLLLVLVAVLSAGLVQLMIPVAAAFNPLEVVLFAAALLLLIIESTGIGAHLLTICTALGWAWAGTREVDAYVLVVALALLVTHTCLTLAAHGHPGAPVPRSVVRRWAT